MVALDLTARRRKKRQAVGNKYVSEIERESEKLRGSDSNGFGVPNSIKTVAPG